MPNPVVHFEILGRDKNVLTAFYEQVFGWQMQPIQDDYTLAKTGGGGIDGGIGSMGPMREHITFYIAVENFEATIASVTEMGGQLAYGPHTIPDGSRIGGFLDPEGHLIGLVEPAPGMQKAGS